MWLGQDGENKAAIPNALFEIAIKKDSENTVDTLVFIFPIIIPNSEQNFERTLFLQQLLFQLYLRTELYHS